MTNETFNAQEELAKANDSQNRMFDYFTSYIEQLTAQIGHSFQQMENIAMLLSASLNVLVEKEIADGRISREEYQEKVKIAFEKSMEMKREALESMREKLNSPEETVEPTLVSDELKEMMESEEK